MFTFVAPALAIGMLLFTPEFLLLKNMVFIVPVLFYAGVIYPMWHRSPYRLEAWSVRVLSGWAHVFALLGHAHRAAAQLAAVGHRGQGARRPTPPLDRR